MWVKAKIALCTTTDPRKRGKVFEADDAHAADWIAKGKAVEATAEEIAEATAEPPAPAPKKKGRAKAETPAPPPPPADQIEQA